MISSLHRVISAETHINNLLGAFATTVATSIEQQIADLGLRSTTAATALVAIYNHSDNTIDVLRQVLNLTHSGAVRMINGLEDDGLAERQRSQHDGRAVTISLTQEGVKYAERILAARARVTSAVVRSLSAKQKIALLPALEAVLSTTTDDQMIARRICKLCDKQVCRSHGCPVEFAAKSATQ